MKILKKMIIMERQFGGITRINVIRAKERGLRIQHALFAHLQRSFSDCNTSRAFAHILGRKVLVEVRMVLTTLCSWI